MTELSPWTGSILRMEVGPALGPGTLGACSQAGTLGMSLSLSVSWLSMWLFSAQVQTDRTASSWGDSAKPPSRFLYKQLVAGVYLH